MNSRMAIAMAVMVAGWAVMPGMARDGEGEGQGHQGQGKRTQMRNQARQEVRTHFQEQRQENQEFRKGLKGMEPAQALTAIKAHADEQYNENKAFLDAEYAKVVEAVKARAAGKEGGEEKIQEILAKMEARRTERVQKMEARHTEIVATLNQLGQKADLTWEDIHAAMKDLHAKNADGRGREGKQEHKQERKGEGKGRHGGPRGGPRGNPGSGVPAVEA